MQVIHWQGAEPPCESQLHKHMVQQGLSPYSWSNGPSYVYAVHKHEYEKVLYCVQGSIRFVLPDQHDASGATLVANLAPGDCLLLPAGTRHSAEVGPQGVTCLEAARKV